MRPVAAAALLLMALLPALWPGSHAHAQVPGVAQPSRPATRLELRLDAIAADVDAVHFGGGLAIPVGTYARVAALVGAGIAHADSVAADEDDVGFSARADVLVRFHFDPIRQSRWGPYAAGGVSVRSDLESCCRGYLALLLGIEGPSRSGRTWAFELGFGGGVRAGVALRGGGGRWR